MACRAQDIPGPADPTPGSAGLRPGTRRTVTTKGLLAMHVAVVGDVDIGAKVKEAADSVFG